MEIDESRRKFWQDFIEYAKGRSKTSIFRGLTNEQIKRPHAIEIYNQNGFRLVVGINEKYARCSYHIKGRNHNDVRSQLKIIIEKINKQFQLKRRPEIYIKENPESMVLFLNDYGYRFPTQNAKEKDILMEWMYLNSVVMNEIPAYFEEKIQIESKTPVVKNFERPKEVRPKYDSIPKVINSENIVELEKSIYQCRNICKMPKERMLLGRLMTGNPDKIDLMLIGIGPNINYAEKRKNREVFGEYGNSGRKIKQLISAIERKKGSLSCWGTNAIKCDYEKKNEKATISTCRKFLLREIEIIHPKIIVLFGLVLSPILLNQRLAHGEVSTLLGKYIFIQSKHPAAYESWEQNMKILTPIILEYL